MSSDLERQIVQAVDIAAGPPSAAGPSAADPNLRNQALEFLNNLQTIPDKCWTPGWNLFTAGTSSEGGAERNSPNARMFGLSLVTSFLEVADPANPATGGAVQFLQEAVLKYLHDEFVVGQGEAGLTFIKNKLAQTITHLLVQTYTLPTPSTLLPQLLNLLRTHPPGSPSTSVSPPPLNAVACDILLATLHDLSLTLGSDVSIRAAKTKEALARDAHVKDEIRAHHASALVEEVWCIIEECSTKVSNGSGERQVNGPTHSLGASNAVDLLVQAVHVAGDYASWVDISFMVTPRTVQLLLSLLHHQIPKLRGAAADALLEIVLKGMKPEDKMELLNVLGLTSIISSLEYATRTSGTNAQLQGLGLGEKTNGFHATPEASSVEGVEFRESIAKLADGIATELAKVVEDANGPEVAPTRLAAAEMLDNHMSLVLSFLADEDDGPSEQVIPCIHTVLGAYKKLKRRTTDPSITQNSANFMRNLMAVTLQKMKYDPDAEWTGIGSDDAEADDDETDEDESAFKELRKSLKQIAAAVAGLDEGLFAASVQGIIFSTLQRFETSTTGGATPPTWQEMEMALYATWFFGETLASATGQTKFGLTPAAFVDTSDLLNSTGRKGAPKMSVDTLRSLPLNILGETIARLAQSSVASFAHPAVQLQFFECLVRYSAFFAVQPHVLQRALEPFLDARGIHNPKKGVRHRVNYLLSRFVRETRLQIPHDLVSTVLESMQVVLVINAKLPDVNPGEDPLAKATDKAGSFDSQLHLYDLIGILLALLAQEPDKQTSLLAAIIAPLSSGLEQAVQRFEASGRTDLVQVLQAHHLILAMSNLAKGFPDATFSTNAENGTPPAWVDAFKAITEQIMAAVSSLRQYYVVREAGRGAFARIVSTIGRAALPFVPTLIDSLLSEVTSVELVDSLNFLGLVVHRYKGDVRSVMDDILLLLIERIFFFLNQPVTGTDDSVERTELQKAYIALIHAIIQSGLDGVLVSEKNQGQLQTLLQSLVYYAGNATDRTCQRSAVTTLSGIVFQWGSTMQGFETFIYDTLVPLVFETPAKPDFDLADAQSQQVLGELASLIKKIYATRGEEVLNFLVTSYFPRINCPPELAQEMAGGLKSQDVKAYRKQLQKFVNLSTGRS